MADSQDDDNWPPREEAVVQNENAMSIDFIKIYAPILLVLAERANARDIIEILNKVSEETQTAVDLNIVQQWLGQSETEYAFSALTADEMNRLLTPVEPLVLQQYTTAINNYSNGSIVTTGKRKLCPISLETTSTTETCINLNNQTYSINAFRTYYNLEKEKKKNDPLYKIVTPTRNEIKPNEEAMLDQFFARLDEPIVVTRGENKRRRAGKKSRKQKKRKTRKSNKKSRKQTR